MSDRQVYVSPYVITERKIIALRKNKLTIKVRKFNKIRNKKIIVYMEKPIRLCLMLIDHFIVNLMIVKMRMLIQFCVCK